MVMAFRWQGYNRTRDEASREISGELEVNRKRRYAIFSESPTHTVSFLRHGLFSLPASTAHLHHLPRSESTAYKYSPRPNATDPFSPRHRPPPRRRRRAPPPPPRKLLPRLLPNRSHSPSLPSESNCGRAAPAGVAIRAGIPEFSDQSCCERGEMRVAF
jgi:hypothetical protein